MLRLSRLVKSDGYAQRGPSNGGHCSGAFSGSSHRGVHYSSTTSPVQTAIFASTRSSILLHVTQHGHLLDSPGSARLPRDDRADRPGADRSARRQDRREVRIPADVRELLAEHDILALPFEEEYGGTGTGTLMLQMGVEEIAKSCASSALILMVQELYSFSCVCSSTSSRSRPRDHARLDPDPHLEAELATPLAIASAARTARSGSSSCATGTPKAAITASPANCCTMPPWDVMQCAICSKNRPAASARPRDRRSPRARRADEVDEEHRRELPFHPQG